jgi:hypothetical protein
MLKTLFTSCCNCNGKPTALIPAVAEPPELHRLKYASPLSRAPTYFKRCNPLVCRVSTRYNHGSTGSMQVFPRTKVSLQLQHNSSLLIYKHVNIITSHAQLQQNLYKRCLNGQARRLVYIHSGKETNTWLLSSSRWTPRSAQGLVSLRRVTASRGRIPVHGPAKRNRSWPCRVVREILKCYTCTWYKQDWVF